MRDRSRTGLLALAFLLLSSGRPTPALARDSATAAQQTRIAAGKRDYIEKIKYLQHAIQADDHFAPALYAFALLEEEHEHDTPTAIKMMTTAMESPWPPGWPRPNDMPRRLSEWYVENGQLDKAAGVLEKMAAANKKDPYAPSHLADVYVKMGKPDQAKPYLDAALKLNPNDVLSLLRLGDVYLSQQNWADASATYQKVLDHAPRGGEIYTQAEKGKAVADQKITIKKVIKYAEIGVPSLIGLLVVASLAGRRRGAGGPVMPRQISASAPPPLPQIPQATADPQTAEGLLQNALFQLARVTNLVEGAAYSVNMDLDTLLPRAVLNVDMDELNRFVLEPDKIQAWLGSNQGAPFFFATEKREGTFTQAFGDLKDAMEMREMRLGVPLVSNGTLLGIIFLGLGKDIGDDLKVKVKRHIEKNMNAVKKTAGEAAAQLHAMMDHEQSYTDTVTKFKTARYVEENLPAFLARAQRSGNVCVAILFEYDSYQQIQDTYGEGQSTTVLKLLAGDVRRVLNEDEDIVARLEGGRFAAFTQHSDEAHAVRIGNRLFEQIQSMKISRTLPPPSGSLGVAVYPTHASDAATLMAKAEEALNQSITGGRGTVTVLPLSVEVEAPAPVVQAPAAGGSPFPGRVGAAPSGTLPRAGFPPPPNMGTGGRPAGIPQAGGGGTGRITPPAMPTGGRNAPPPMPSGSRNAPPPMPSGSRNAPPPMPSGGSRPPSPGMPGAIPAAPAPIEEPKAPPVVPGPAKSPFGTPPASPFVPGRPTGGLGNSPFVPGRAPGGASPFVPGRPPSPFGKNGPNAETPAPAAPEAPEGEAPRTPFSPPRPGGSAPASPFAAVRPPMGTSGGSPPAVPPPVAPPPVAEKPPPPPPYIPSRRAGTKSDGLNGGTDTPGRSMTPPSVPPPAHLPPAPSVPKPFVPGGGRNAGASPFIPGRPVPAPSAAPGADSGGAPPPFVPSRRPEAPARKSAPPASAGTAVASSPAEKEGYQPRTQFEATLQTALQEASGAGDSVSIVYLALDNFPQIEALGPDATARAIQSVAGMVKSLLNEAEDVPGVWSGNGLVILKPRTSSEGGINFAEWVRVTVSHLNFPELSQPLTVSMGVATYPEDAQTPAELVGCAEQACRQAASLGGNTSHQYTA